MSTKMSEPRDLFLHELGDVLYAERTLVKTLPKLQEEASDEELALGFEEHLDETKQHVKNVEQAFEMLGEKPTAEKCPGIEGIKQEHDDFVTKESPSQDVLDSFLTGAGPHWTSKTSSGTTTAMTREASSSKRRAGNPVPTNQSPTYLHSHREPAKSEQADWPHRAVFSGVFQLH